MSTSSEPQFRAGFIGQGPHEAADFAVGAPITGSLQPLSIATPADAGFTSTSQPTRPQLRVCVLGSGSGGNSTVIMLGERGMLIDAGFGPRTTRHRLLSARVPLDAIEAICVTHFDRDHFRPTWISTMLQQRIRLLVHAWHEDELYHVPGGTRLIDAGLVTIIGSDGCEPLPGISATCIRLPHDHKGTTAFHLESEFGSIGFATDLGCVPPALIERFIGVDLLAIECNYDPEMQRRSSRPLSLKRRIMGKAGHLSNRQAFEAVRQIVDRSPPGQPQKIVLLHRSRQCNCPHLVQSVFDEDPRIGPYVIQTDQRRRTPWITVTPGARPMKQLGLF